MNSSNGSFDHLNDGWWYDRGWDSTPSLNDDYALDCNAFSNSDDAFALLPTGLQSSPSWQDINYPASLTTSQYDFNQGQQVWCLSHVPANRPLQYVPSNEGQGRRDAELMRIAPSGAIAASTPPLDSVGSITNRPCTYARSTAADQLSVAPETLRALFPSPSLPRTEPTRLYDDNGQLLFQQQQPRFEGDLYAALWVRGEGVSREGWCGFCSTWHRLKDSAYW